MGLISLLSKGLTLESFLQHHSLKASILQCSAFFIVQLSHLYMTTGKTIALTTQTFVGKVMENLQINLQTSVSRLKEPDSFPVLLMEVDTYLSTFLKLFPKLTEYSGAKRRTYKLLDRKKQLTYKRTKDQHSSGSSILESHNNNGLKLPKFLRRRLSLLGFHAQANDWIQCERRRKTVLEHARPENICSPEHFLRKLLTDVFH